MGKAPSSTVREFTVDAEFPFVFDAEEDRPWYEGVYPDDAELRESFRQFAEAGGLSSPEDNQVYEDANCLAARTPECANLVLSNIDAWAAWYETNG